jgi:hypothetical protein
VIRGIAYVAGVATASLLASFLVFDRWLHGSVIGETLLAAGTLAMVVSSVFMTMVFARCHKIRMAVLFAINILLLLLISMGLRLGGRPLLRLAFALILYWIVQHVVVLARYRRVFFGA